jgi:hypothetical protein
MSVAPASEASAPPITAGEGATPEERPTRSGLLRRHRRAVASALGAVLIAGFVYYVVPQIAGLGPTLERLRGGDLWWLAIGVLFEVISVFGEILLFRGVFSRPVAGSDGASAIKSRSRAVLRRRSSRPPGRAVSRSRSGRCAPAACLRPR